MASCAGGGVNSPGPLEPEVVDKLAAELFKCVKKDQLVKAKIILKGLRKEDKKRIVCKSFDGNTPLFIAAQQGLSHFVNYLINDCLADIEQRGVYEVAEDRSRHQVTPLWCAAVANKLEVVKILIRHTADVNATSDTESTPVRSACYMTNIEVVKYLVDNGANIHKPNINGGTCLINSVQSVDLCRYLIEKNANVNAQDNSGNLALHYAIREGRMETVRLLLKHGSDPYVRNDFGDDAVQTAALRGYSDILEFLLYRIKPTIERQIEAYELMATNFVDEKHDIQQAIQTWRLAMELRFKDSENVITKPQSLPNAAYQNNMEAGSMEELEEVAKNPDAVYMQALIIRERILGPDHKDTVFGLMYRGAVYADTHRYQRCVDLWKYAFQLRHAKQEPLNHECLFTLQALCKLFWEIYDEYVGGFTSELVQFDDIHEVFEMSVSELKRAQRNLGAAVAPVAPGSHQHEEFHTILLLVVHLINLLCAVPKDEARTYHFKRTVHALSKLRIVTAATCKSLLHLAIDKRTSSVAEEYYSQFPSARVVAVLLECGADVNATDADGNTPLHLCVASLSLPTSSLAENLRTELENVVESLLKNGAHVDAVNKNGVVAAKDLGTLWPRWRLLDYLTLKCMAARAVKQHGIPYKGEVPESLISFLDMH